MTRPDQILQKRKFSVIFTALILTGLFMGLPLPQAAAQEVSFATYTNARFGYSIKYPAGVLVPQGESENGDGQRFISPDGRSVLTVWGSHNALGESLEENFRQALQDVGGKVTYQVKKGNWYVFSGYRGGAILYQKTYLINGVFKTFTWEYPEEQRGLFDRVTGVIAASFTGR
jgi:hypothetical protein